MRHWLLTKLIGSQWRTFCGMSRAEFHSLATSVLDDEGFEFETTTFDPTSGERVMFGSENEGDRITVSSPIRFEIDVITATAGPVRRFGLGFVLDEEQRKEATGGLCIVTVRELNSETQPTIARFMREVIADADRPPWETSHHAVLRLAILLRLKIRLLWKYWLRTPTETDEPLSEPR